MSFESPNELPYPSPQEVELSTSLVEVISEEIKQQGGKIPFARYMELALYAPTLGYYVNGRLKLGEGGDFITAPELTPLFTQCLGNQVIEVFDKINTRASVLEFGGGSGALALEMLTYLEKQGNLPEHYYILDVSPYLTASQRVLLSDKIPHLMEKIHWVSDIPDEFVGVIIANEVLDAMPVNQVCFHTDGKHTEIFVAEEEGRFVKQEHPISNPRLSEAVSRIYDSYGDRMPDSYTGEINLFIKGWMQLLYEHMKKGIVILIDYGYPRSQWYIPDRYEGTLSCYYRHRHHSNPLILPGLQDITAHVDFTDVAEKADEAGFNISGYANQAAFLTSCGLEELLQHLDTSDTINFLATTSPIKKLILPHEMGELFKVMILNKEFNEELRGFILLEQSGRL